MNLSIWTPDQHTSLSVFGHVLTHTHTHRQNQAEAQYEDTPP